MTETVRRKVQYYLQEVGGGVLTSADESFFDTVMSIKDPSECDILNGTYFIMQKRVSNNICQSANLEGFKRIANNLPVIHGYCTIRENELKIEPQVRFSLGIPFNE